MKMNTPLPFPRRKPPARPAPASAERRPIAPPRLRSDNAFLPATLELLETPPSPVGVALIWIICVLAFASLAWAYFGKIDVLAVAQGKVQPTGRVKVIQPVEAGRIAELLVQNGQKVAEGETLATLDSGEADAEVNELNSNYNAYRADATRRRAAQAAVTARDITHIPAVIYESDIPQLIQARETHVLEADLGQLAAEVASLKAQQMQKLMERDRYVATLFALQDLISTLQERVDARKSLVTSGAGSRADLIAALETLQTQQASLATARGQIIEADAAIEVLSRNIETSYHTFAAQNLEKLAEAERQADEAEQRLAKARARQRKMVLKSPLQGTISALTITAAGQVVSAGEEIMRVVPDALGLEIEAYIPNRDVGFVRQDQEAIIKIESLPFTRYGTIKGKLTRIASDAIPEPEASQSEADPAKAGRDRGFAGAQRTQNLVFAATFKPETSSLTADGVAIPLSPGMAVTVEIKTGSRRILDYIFSPLMELASQSMKER